MKFCKKMLCVSLAFLSVLLCGCESFVERFYPEQSTDAHSVFVPETTESGGTFFKDFDGYTVIMDDAPDKVVCLSDVATEIICGIGASRYIVALDKGSAETDGAPISAHVLDGGYTAEDIKGFNADVVFYSDNNNRNGIIETLRADGVRCVRIPSTGGINAAEANIRFISALMYKETAGDRVIEEMRAEFNRVKLSAEIIGLRKTVYVETPTPFLAFGGDSIISELCEMSGGDNIFADKTGTFITNAAQVAELDPEVIFVLTRDPDGFSTDQFRKRDGITQVKAVKTKSVFAVDYDEATRPTQNIIYALRTVSTALGAVK